MEEKEALSEFLEFIYGNNEGFAYLAFKSASTTQNSWRQEWYSWPGDREKLIKRILDQRGRADVFYGPALYSTKNAVRDSILGCGVIWVDFDGNCPEFDLVNPKPSYILQSSMAERQHWYWKLETFTDDIQGLEFCNRNLAYEYGADVSGWDITQVLRPPFTVNHKNGLPTRIRYQGDSIYNLESLLSTIPKVAPDPIDIQSIGKIPSVEDTLSRYVLKAPAWLLFQKGAPVGKRSEALMSLAYDLAEMNMTNEEILCLLIDADERWGKFKNRKDQIKRLLEIVSVARAKYPWSESSISGKRLQVFGFKELLFSEAIQLEWIWEGLLQKSGYLLLTGAPKIGKTQFSLDFGARAVLGEEFLDRPCRKELKLGFLSLEMSNAELKSFLESQAMGLSEEELAILDENFKMIGLGEPYYLNRKNEQDEIEEMIHEYHLDGLIIDSLGSTMEGELSGEKDAKSLMDWNDRIRRRHECFTWFIHHHRKATGDNKNPKGLADIYGSYIFTARATTALTLWNSGHTNSIQLIPNAVRLAETPTPFPIYRDGKLRFTTKKSGLTIIKKGKDIDELDIPDDEEFTSGKFSY